VEAMTMLTTQGVIFRFATGIFLMMALIYCFSGDPNSVPVGILCFCASGFFGLGAIIDYVLARKE
jgi:hypothetical protein